VTIYSQRQHVVIVHRANIASVVVMNVLVQKRVTPDVTFFFLRRVLFYADTNSSALV
jgi:hypothetical protein